ncbi:MAG: hypothetical protein GKR96_12940 [Gammaproteobacteria bacterium]|nr:hypothetical protein [Gammaproteobacteria bacterium]
MNNKVIATVSWAIVSWVCYVFLFSLPYKFTMHPDTQHIFGTIGQWMVGYVGSGIGNLFANVGPFIVGGVELLTSLILLLPLVLWLLSFIGLGKNTGTRASYHKLGGIMASVVMSGAVFFHLATPLGIKVLHQGVSDNGRLFYSAVSILVLGVVLWFINSKLEE